MKSLITTILLLLLVVTLTVLNFHYVNNTVCHLQTLLDTLPSLDDPDCVAHAEKTEAFWKEKESLIGLTVSYPFVDRISEQTALLVSTARAKDLYGFESARALLYDAVEDMGRAERFSPKNLF